MATLRSIVLDTAEWWGRLWVRPHGLGSDPAIQAILVAEAGGIGDLLNIYPALYALRQAFPRAAVALLAAPIAREVAELWPERCFDELLTYEWNGVHRTIPSKLRLIHTLRRRRFDLIYSPDRGAGMREEALMAFLMGARHRLGFSWGKAGSLCTVRLPLAEDRPIQSQNLDILRAAGIPIERPLSTLRPGATAERQAEALLRDAGVAELRTVVMHLTAAWEGSYRCWAPSRFGAVAHSILRQHEDAAVVVVGTAQDADAGQAALAIAGDPRALNLCGRTNLPTLAALVARAELVIGNDSSVLHIAAACGTPMVAIFGSTRAEQVLPSPQEVTVVTADVPCRPCYLHQDGFAPPCGRPVVPECLERISVEQVCRAVHEHLRRMSPARG